MDIFCKIINGEIPSKKLYEDKVVMVIMDVNPVSSGHCLVIPKNHYKDIYDIDNDTLIHIFEVARRISVDITNKLNCDGITFTENNGSVQEVKHFHLHIVPKYEYDNKMSVEEVFEILK